MPAPLPLDYLNASNNLFFLAFFFITEIDADPKADKIPRC